MYYHTINAVSGPVHCIAQSDALLSIGSGKVVQLVKQATIGAFQHPLISLDFLGDCTNIKQFSATWERVVLLPDPPKFPELEGELPELMARSLHFLGGGSDVLLATYLDHGVMYAFFVSVCIAGVINDWQRMESDNSRNQMAHSPSLV